MGKTWSRLKARARERKRGYHRDYREGKNSKGAALIARQYAFNSKYEKEGAANPDSKKGRMYKARQERKKANRKVKLAEWKKEAAADPNSEGAQQLEKIRADSAASMTKNNYIKRAKDMTEKMFAGSYIIAENDTVYSSNSPRKSRENYKKILGGRKLESYSRDELEAKIVGLLYKNALHRITKSNRINRNT